MVKKIMSGGQTGADRAALDVALHCGIEHGGSIPKGKRAENGVVHPIYQLDELSTTSYPKRTEKNIMDSDGTLILSHGRLTGGSALTRRLAEQHKKPVLHVDLSKFSRFDAVSMVKKWIERNNVEVLNVAGSRGSKDPLIYRETVELLCGVLGFYPPPSDIPGFYITESLLAYAA